MFAYFMNFCEYKMLIDCFYHREELSVTSAFEYCFLVTAFRFINHLHLR